MCGDFLYFRYKSIFKTQIETPQMKNINYLFKIPFQTIFKDFCLGSNYLSYELEANNK